MNNENTLARKIRIDNCGKAYRWVFSIIGLWKKKVLYCGYINDCNTCRSIERSKRKSVIERHIMSTDLVFSCEISQDDWKRLYKKLNKAGIEFMKHPQPEGSFLVTTNKDPNHTDFCFIERSHTDVIRELTTDDNLFVKNGRRSSSSNWSFEYTPKEKDLEMKEETVQIKTMEPIFSNNTSGYKIPFDDLYPLVKACNTWTGGRVTKDNAQEYITNSVGTLIALHLAAGYTWNKDESRIVLLTIPVSDIEKWKVHSVKYSERAFYGTDIDGNRLTEDTFYEKEDQVLAVIHGVVDIPDRIAELEQYQIDIDDDVFNLFK